MKTYTQKGTVLAILLLFGAAGCADLDVQNPNAADRDRALATAGDVESLLAGSWATHYSGYNSYYGAAMFLSVQAFEHSASWNNACMVPCAALPRPELQNDPAWSFYGNISRFWDYDYRALAAIADAFRALDGNPEIADELGAEAVTRMQAFGRFMQGLAHGSLAVFYDQAFVVDETTDVENLGEPVPYTDVLTAALGYLDQAISIASGASFTIPASWANNEMSAEELAQLASTYKARLRAAVARTPAEREAVDWATVISELDAGIDERMLQFNYNEWFNQFLYYGHANGWAWMDYMIWGMADQSGDVEAWWNLPPGDRYPEIGDSPVRIVTPDERFPQGSTIEEQVSNPGTVFEVATTTFHSSISEVWKKPDRGTWRWSWYRPKDIDQFVLIDGEGEFAEVSADEIRLLKAEAYYRMGDTGMAADLVDVTRTANGLDPIADGSNDSCVPRLPDGTCGDLFEALKWEKRLETRMTNLFHTGAYLDSRGWGDLYTGTQTSFPIPCGELQILQVECYNVGGGADFSAPTSTYAWPHES